MRNLAADLEQQASLNLYRTRNITAGPQGPEVIIDKRRYLSFCSNDYLGLANHPKLVEALQRGAIKYGAGSGASHLISGHSVAHHRLEETLAEFTGRPRALLFSTGYMANLGVVSALAQRGDIIYEDRLNHASLLDAGLLSGARLQRYPHADTETLTMQLAELNNRPGFIISDGIFSMDGDIAPLPALADIAQRHNNWLMIDDAHGFGVMGPHGRGSLEEFGLGMKEVPILVCTLGKALGTFGAFVAGSEELIESLIQHARTYIYTTALPPAIAYATAASLSLLEEEAWRRDHLFSLIKQFRDGARQLNLPLQTSRTPIQPLIIGDTENALKTSQLLRDKGILISAIRPPTVPKGGARLRITLSAAHSEAHIDRLLQSLDETVNTIIR